MPPMRYVGQVLRHKGQILTLLEDCLLHENLKRWCLGGPLKRWERLCFLCIVAKCYYQYFMQNKYVGSFGIPI
jgi:hypothetical protein